MRPTIPKQKRIARVIPTATPLLAGRGIVGGTDVDGCYNYGNLRII